jgi:predicted nucleic acid-binding protein
MRPDEHFRDAIVSAEIVVADTSPLNYLVQISCDFLLPSLYRRVIVPPSVLSELTAELRDASQRGRRRCPAG